MSLQDEFMKKSLKILRETNEDKITTRQYRKKMFSIRLTKPLLRTLMRDLEKAGLIKYHRNGDITILKERLHCI